MPEFLDYAGHRVAYYVHGRGAPVLFLHGWPTNANLWNAQVAAFRKNHRVITLDWLGFGASDRPSDHNYTFTHQKQILDTLMKEVIGRRERITLVAHDIGGPPALMWAAENAKRVRRLILLNTVLYPLATLIDRASHILFKVPLLNSLLMSDFGLTQIMKSNTRSKDPAILERIHNILPENAGTPKAIRIRTILETMNEGRRNELRALSTLFRKLRVEKQLIIAKEDPLCFAHIDKLRQANPEVPVHYLDHCGHYIPIDRPGELNAVLRKILR